MIANPNLALLLAAMGVLGIYWELCRPGRVFPGILGGVALLVGMASLANLPDGARPSPVWAALILTPLLVITIWLARIARRARRNKRVN